MFMAMFSQEFDTKTKRANYDYYAPRTVHKSSLSPAMHALVAADVGDLNGAYNFFNVALRADLANYFDNTAAGIHAASLGGVWQAIIFGSIIL